MEAALDITHEGSTQLLEIAMKRGQVTFIVFVALYCCCGITQKATAAPDIYIANLNGLNQSPSNVSPATGTAQVTIDLVAHILTVDTTFSGLQGTTTAAHIHALTATPGTGLAGVATQMPVFPGFPLGVTAASYSSTFDTTNTATFNSSFITAHGGTAAGAEAALAAGLASDMAYFNIHTTAFPGGEIRGFLSPQTIPEPCSILLVWSGLLGLSSCRRRFF